MNRRLAWILGVALWLGPGCRGYDGTADREPEPVARTAEAVSAGDAGSATPSLGSFPGYATEAIELGSGASIRGGCNVGVEGSAGPFLGGGAAAYLSSGSEIQSSETLYA